MLKILFIYSCHPLRAIVFSTTDQIQINFSDSYALD